MNQLRSFVRNYSDDALLLLGCACILFGLSKWNVVVTWIVAGLMLIGFGVMLGKAKANASANLVAKPEE